MPPRIPIPSDFPSTLTLTIIPPPPTPSGPPQNILILLHGLGDTHTPFSTLAKSLSLPSTACIALRASIPIPALFTGDETPSFHWGDDIQFSSETGSLEIDSGFETSVKLLREIVDILKGKCGFEDRSVFFLGFGQGGMAALGAVASLSSDSPAREFGGVISIGGAFPESVKIQGEENWRTPILVCGGNRKTEITKRRLEGLKNVFKDVEYVKWEREGDGMMRNREEMLPLMRFWGRRLRSRVGVPEGAVEV